MDNYSNLKSFFENYFPDKNILTNTFYKDLLIFFSESESDFLARRHKELKNEGFKNSEIFDQISAEIKNHLFRGNNFSRRQIKRIIYKE